MLDINKSTYKQIQKLSMGVPILRFIGRLLFITILLTSAYLKLTNAQSHTLQFNYGYSSIRKSHSIFNSLPDSTELSKIVPISTIVKAIAGYQIVTALLILIGDTYGGLLFQIYLIVSFLANYGDLAVTVIRTQSLVAFKGKQLQLAFWGILFGFSLVFMQGVPKRKRAVKL